MSKLELKNINNQQSGHEGISSVSQKRPLDDAEIEDIVTHVIPRVRSLLAEPFIRYSGTPEEVVEAAVTDYIDEIFKQRESEIIANLKTKLESRAALEDLRGEIKRLKSGKGAKEIRDAVQLVYDMQMAELDQLRLGLRQDLLEVEIYPEMIDSLKENLWVQYRGAEIAPGTSVGNIATDSISAPAVQLTLDTFHSTGSVMTVDAGLELLQSVLYATKTVKNPFMTVHFNEVEYIYEKEVEPINAPKKRGKGGKGSKKMQKETKRMIKKEYISFEKILTEKRAEMRHLTFFHVLDAETVDTRATLVGKGKKRMPWWYSLYKDTYHHDIKPIGENQYMMRIELNMNELYLSHIDQFEIASILWRELKDVQIIPSPVLRYPARFSDIYTSEEGDQDADFDDDRYVLVPVVYIDIIPEPDENGEERQFYASEDYRKLTETVMNSFHEITIKGIPGIMEVQPGNQRILEVITNSDQTGDAEDVEELLEDAINFYNKKHASETVLSGLRAYEKSEIDSERAFLGFVKLDEFTHNGVTRDIIHFPDTTERDERDEAQKEGKKALTAWKKQLKEKRRLEPWLMYIDRIGMRMKGFPRSKIEDALEYAGVYTVGWIEETRAMNYIPQADIIQCLSTRDPQKLLQDLINEDEQLAIRFSRDQMAKKVELYKDARFQEANGVSLERKSSILERLYFTALADVSGYNLEKVWAMSSVNASLTYCNDMHLLFEMLGIEALRNYEQEMLFRALKSAASSMDLRHVNLVIDMTTRRGVLDSIKLAGLRNQNIPSIVMAALEDPLGCIAKSASTGEVSTLNSPYAALLFGQVPSNHPAIPEVTMTPEYERVYLEAMERRVLKPEEIDEALWNDMYQPEIVISEEGGKVKNMQGGTVQREDILLPVTKPVKGPVKPNSILAHTVKDRMGRIDDWIAPMGAVSSYTAKSMLKIAADEKRAIADGKRESPKEESEKIFVFEAFKPLVDVERELVGVSELPEDAITSTMLSVPEQAYSIPQFGEKSKARSSIQKILKAL